MDGQRDELQGEGTEHDDAAMSNDTIRVRIDREPRNRAAAVLHAAGLTIIDAVRTLLIRVAEDQELPYRLFPPSDEAIAAARRTIEQRERTYAASRRRRQDDS